MNVFQDFRLIVNHGYYFIVTLRFDEILDFPPRLQPRSFCFGCGTAEAVPIALYQGVER
jgi:hypothetical protein